MTSDTPQSAVAEQTDHDHETHAHHHPKRLIFAPGDIQATTPRVTKHQHSTTTTTSSSSSPALNPLLDDSALSRAPTPSANAAVLSHPARAHQFLTNPPLTVRQLHPTNPLHQFHTWFRDPRLHASSAPETCTLATASMPSGRVSARIVYLKELDERGWVVYSNWGSRAGKGGQVFGTEEEDGSVGLEEGQGRLRGNRWAALTFNWPSMERQVRVEGLVERLSRAESEMYWRVRERGSQIGAWASQQSKVLWSREPGELVEKEEEEEEDDGRSVLENWVKEMEERFADTEEIPLPPFWGGVRLVPESVEFWQGRKSRLHDRFRYVRVHQHEGEDEKSFRWRIQRLSP
ncbi:pyridoxamine-phosphate oxidase [Emydomyces testavorans]|uniref:pyridoxal 5'-phosphate synthase n=1 Tax=Emydomyces testavorans TaxID=2070801 RepID=A0AAF0DHH2_9EURO|nr:pyridoxamine-phosphate oxidase [Emydomyces testavorans]